MAKMVFMWFFIALPGNRVRMAPRVMEKLILWLENTAKMMDKLLISQMVEIPRISQEIAEK